mgnify:FL=1
MVGKDLDQNILRVAQGNDHPALFSAQLRTAELYWVAGSPPETPFRCKAKVRYRQADQDCQVSRVADGFVVDFDQPQRAVTPGQSVVFYDGERCLGGGVIEQTH